MRDIKLYYFAELLRVIRETENDDLTGVMQKLISTYGDKEQVAVIAVDIAKDLVRDWSRDEILWTADKHEIRFMDKINESIAWKDRADMAATFQSIC